VPWGSPHDDCHDDPGCWFDIGGVLEINPDLGVAGMRESRLGLGPGKLNERMADVRRAGCIGTISEDDVRQAVRERLGLGDGQLAEFMSDLWREYLGIANTEPIGYVRQMLPRCRTGVLSNSVHCQAGNRGVPFLLGDR
jgi:hypothetical protein